MEDYDVAKFYSCISSSIVHSNYSLLKDSFRNQNSTFFNRNAMMVTFSYYREWNSCCKFFDAQLNVAHNGRIRQIAHQQWTEASETVNTDRKMCTCKSVSKSRCNSQSARQVCKKNLEKSTLSTEETINTNHNKIVQSNFGTGRTEARLWLWENLDISGWPVRMPVGSFLVNPNMVPWAYTSLPPQMA